MNGPKRKLLEDTTITYNNSCKSDRPTFNKLDATEVRRSRTCQTVIKSAYRPPNHKPRIQSNSIPLLKLTGPLYKKLKSKHVLNNYKSVYRPKQSNCSDLSAVSHNKELRYSEDNLNGHASNTLNKSTVSVDEDFSLSSTNIIADEVLQTCSIYSLLLSTFENSEMNFHTIQSRTKGPSQKFFADCSGMMAPYPKLRQGLSNIPWAEMDAFESDKEEEEIRSKLMVTSTGELNTEWSDALLKYNPLIDIWPCFISELELLMIPTISSTYSRNWDILDNLSVNETKFLSGSFDTQHCRVVDYSFRRKEINVPLHRAVGQQSNLFAADDLLTLGMRSEYEGGFYLSDMNQSVSSGQIPSSISWKNIKNQLENINEGGCQMPSVIQEDSSNVDIESSSKILQNDSNQESCIPPRLDETLQKENLANVADFNYSSYCRKNTLSYSEGNNAVYENVDEVQSIIDEKNGKNVFNKSDSYDRSDSDIKIISPGILEEESLSSKLVSNPVHQNHIIIKSLPPLKPKGQVNSDLLECVPSHNKNLENMPLSKNANFVDLYNPLYSSVDPQNAKLISSPQIGIRQDFPHTCYSSASGSSVTISAHSRNSPFSTTASWSSKPNFVVSSGTPAYSTSGEIQPPPPPLHVLAKQADTTDKPHDPHKNVPKPPPLKLGNQIWNQPPISYNCNNSMTLPVSSASSCHSHPLLKKLISENSESLQKSAENNGSDIPKVVENENNDAQNADLRKVSFRYILPNCSQANAVQSCEQDQYLDFPNQTSSITPNSYPHLTCVVDKDSSGFLTSSQTSTSPLNNQFIVNDNLDSTIPVIENVFSLSASEKATEETVVHNQTETENFEHSLLGPFFNNSTNEPFFIKLGALCAKKATDPIKCVSSCKTASGLDNQPPQFSKTVMNYSILNNNIAVLSSDNNLDQSSAISNVTAAVVDDSDALSFNPVIQDCFSLGESSIEEFCS